MKNLMAVKKLCLIAVLALSVAGLAACSGSDGSNGARGPAGATGPQGPAGPVTTTNPSCLVCHGSGKILDIDSTSSDSVHFNAGQDASPLTISNIQLTNVGGTVDVNGIPVTGTLDVSFHVADSSGNDYTSLGADGTEVMIGNLVPKDIIPIQATTQNYQSPLFNLWTREGVNDPYNHGGAKDTWQTFTNDGSGDYTVRLAPDILVDAVDQTVNSYYQYNDLTNDVQRVAIMISGAANPGLTLPAIAVGVNDFQGVPLTDGATSTAATQQYNAAYVTIQACQQCHGKMMQGAAHGSYWADTRVCVMCHSPSYDGLGIIEPAKAIFSQWIHEIHDGQILGNQDFSDVKFPQPIDDCTVCHQDPDNLMPAATALNPGVGAWMTNPTATACATCHYDVNPLNVPVDGFDAAGIPITLTAGQNHLAGPEAASSCAGCHTGLGTANSSTDIVTVHKLPDFVDGNDTTTLANIDPTLLAMNTPEFDVTITVEDVNGVPITDANGVYVKNGGYFKAGDTVNVAVTMKDHATGSAVASTVYTNAEDSFHSTTPPAGNGSMNEANLYVYGPRSMPAPALTTSSGESLLLDGSGAPVSGDAQVMTDSTGFKYQLLPIDSNTTAGTYLVSFHGQDYGAGSDTDYITESVGLTKFQIKTATVEKKVSGDACAGCHGTTRMHLTGAHPHDVPFDTDYCNACHDAYSSGYGNTIANRVHAIHSATSNGDLGPHASYDWADINFPQDVNNCKACHTSGATGYLTGFWPAACFGCHPGSNNTTWQHMLQNGAKVLDQDPNFK